MANGHPTTTIDPFIRVSDRIAALMAGHYTGQVIVTVRLHQGGVRQLTIREEYPVDLVREEKSEKNDKNL